MLIGVDIGTTSIKAGIFDEKGKKIITASKEYQLINRSNTQIEANPEIYWTCFKQVLAEMFTRKKVNSKEIKAISFSTQGQTFIPVDAYGKPVYNAIVWIDTRASNESEKINSVFKSKEFINKGYRFYSDVIDTGAKILWLREHKPDIFKKIKKFLLIEDYFCWKLTGNCYLSYNNAWTTGMVDFSKGQWWNEMLEFIGIEKNQLSVLTHTARVVGRIKKDISEETGLAEGTVVVSGSNDQTACACGVGNVTEGIVSITLGTALVIYATTNEHIVNKKYHVLSTMHVVENKEYVILFSKTMGIVLKWFRENLMRNIPYNQLDRFANMSYPGAKGLTFIPHFAGSMHPVKIDNARGAFVGLTLEHKKSDIIRSILESGAYSIRENLELLIELGIKPDTVRIYGGGARSQLWIQIISDVLKLPVEQPTETETGILGAALYAGTAIGVWKNLYEASKNVYNPKKIFYPNKNCIVYDKPYQQYKSIFNKLYSQ